jgi:hypothetical protein
VAVQAAVSHKVYRKSLVFDRFASGMLLIVGLFCLYTRSLLTLVFDRFASEHVDIVTLVSQH